MKTDNQLHKELFELFIIKFMDCYWVYDHIDDNKPIGDIVADYLHDLFPQQNHPEEFVRYVSDAGLAYARKGGCVEAYEKDNYFKHKIKITVCAEEE
jgi:hypothetical protein